MGLCTCVYNHVRATNTHTAGALSSPHPIYIVRVGSCMLVYILCVCVVIPVPTVRVGLFMLVCIQSA